MDVVYLDYEEEILMPGSSRSGFMCDIGHGVTLAVCEDAPLVELVAVYPNNSTKEDVMRVINLVSESEQLVRDGKISRDDYPAYLRREIQERMKREALEEKEKDPTQK